MPLQGSGAMPTGEPDRRPVDSKLSHKDWLARQLISPPPRQLKQVKARYKRVMPDLPQDPHPRSLSRGRAVVTDARTYKVARLIKLTGKKHLDWQIILKERSLINCHFYISGPIYPDSSRYPRKPL